MKTGNNDQNEDQINQRRVLIVGAGKVGRTLASNLQLKREYLIVGFVDDLMEDVCDPIELSLSQFECPWPLLGSREETARLVKEHRIDDVMIAYAPSWQQRLAEDLALNNPDVQVRVVPSVYEASLQVHRLDSYGDIALLPLVQQRRTLNTMTKRAVDILVSSGILVAVFPFLCLIGVLIKLTSPGPVLFIQERVGKRGKRFLLYKFRTMRVDAEAETGPMLSTGPHDTRLTNIGRRLRLMRLDEVPQLWNVIRGEMSLIGPRPEREKFVRKFIAQNSAYVQRHQVRPGITGLAQVYGGYHTDARDKLRFDLIYVSHFSLALDLFIILRTLKIMLIPDVESHVAPKSGIPIITDAVENSFDKHHLVPTISGTPVEMIPSQVSDAS